MIYKLFLKAKNDLNFEYLDLFKSNICVAKIDENNYYTEIEKLYKTLQFLPFSSKALFKLIDYLAENENFLIDAINDDAIPEELSNLIELKDYTKIKDYLIENKLLIKKIDIYDGNCQIKLAKSGDIKLNKEECIEKPDVIKMFQYVLSQ